MVSRFHSWRTKSVRISGKKEEQNTTKNQPRTRRRKNILKYRQRRQRKGIRKDVKITWYDLLSQSVSQLVSLCVCLSVCLSVGHFLEVSAGKCVSELVELQHKV